ncbi:hypothetical protein PBI_EISH_97 [Mycobacterium phage Eish]|uniref:Uncharacterized protein n=1 Tax=Mycobacterium phage Eish TaxID=2656575 RepID=A0A649V941_9CAUD|nr:hypothetical protein I5H31_gp097 [Mycobacterium phage Eish]QGJ88482.1 hypothetical protein PBI_EISH_97 [Mycobacterium phage Eish]
MREITVYEEDDPSHMFGFCDQRQPSHRLRGPQIRHRL